MILSDIKEIKTILDIANNDTSEDKKLLFYAEWASDWIEELLNRQLRYKARTEYYGGTNTQKLQLRVRPVYTSPTILVYLDESGFYGSASGAFDPLTTELVYGTDFALQLDGSGSTSRSGILIRMNNLWPKPNLRLAGLLSPFVGEGFGTIKVTYTAGFNPDDLPSPLRTACNLLVAKMRSLFPVGIEVGSESYEERSLSYIVEKKDYLLSSVKPLILSYRNWTF